MSRVLKRGETLIAPPFRRRVRETKCRFRVMSARVRAPIITSVVVDQWSIIGVRAVCAPSKIAAHGPAPNTLK
ncbi:MAG: hypothetical protein DWQ08_02890 [Proteobacteria bacterium]|nr:MAG: hypothetical protein DWQ08_02890 [Pseudomonadota bacterium]